MCIRDRTNPNDVTWAGLNTGGAGGQPSFAQIASGGDITFIGGQSPITASNAGTQNYNSNYVFFNTSDISGVQIGFEVTGVSGNILIHTRPCLFI